MRKILVIALVCLCAQFAFATATVSGALQDPSGTAVTSRTFVRFTLRGCGGNQARVTGAAIVVPSIYDFTPNGSGAISGTIFRNDTEISCGGSLGVTWWGVAVWRDGRAGPEAPYTIAAGTFNLNSATPNTTNPVVASPTGDSTYLRLDGGNAATFGTWSNHWIPGANNTYDLGSSSNAWRDLWLSRNLKVATANNITFAFTNPAAPRTYTFPDAGANATIPYLEKVQTWNAAQGFPTGTTCAASCTFSSPIVTGTVTQTGATIDGGTYKNATFTGASSGNSVNLLNQQAAAAAIVGTGADADLFSFSIPANIIGSGKGIRVKAAWQHSVGSAAPSYKLKLGGTTLVTKTGSTGSNLEKFDLILFNNNGSTTAQNWESEAFTNAAFSIDQNTSAENTGNALTIKATFSVAATDQVTPKFWLVELVQ